MKLKLFAQILAASAFVLGNLTTISQSSSAQTSSDQNTPTFFCDASEDVPTTFAQTATGRRIALISWQSSFFSSSGYSPLERCQRFSGRLQAAYVRGSLNYITSGSMNGYPIVCAARQYRGPCSDVLFTVRQGEDPNEWIKNVMLPISFMHAAVSPVHQSEDSDVRVYIDVNNLLRSAPANTFDVQPKNPDTPNRQEISFFCGLSNGVPTTMVHNSRVNSPLIKWVSDYYPESGEDNFRRCVRVSGIFQSYYQQGILNYITTGIMDENPVVCAVSSDGGQCNRLLFKLKPDEDPFQVMQNLFGNADRTFSIPLER